MKLNGLWYWLLLLLSVNAIASNVGELIDEKEEVITQKVFFDINHGEEKVGRIVTVSYTHLDVYKRQQKNHGPCTARSCFQKAQALKWCINYSI